MFTPKSFAESDPHKLHDVLEQHSFATLVTNEDGGLVASHLPLLLDRNAGSHGTLIGHMARANSQWKHATTQEVLAIFHGPHTYISPRWLDEKNVVPTWNYVVVHVYGTMQMVTERDRLLDIVRRYVTVYEADMPEPWSLDEPDPKFVDGLLDGIVGFTIAIDRMEGKWKLNQNHNEQRRSRVVSALQQQGGDQATAIAKLMRENLEDRCPSFEDDSSNG